MPTTDLVTATIRARASMMLAKARFLEEAYAVGIETPAERDRALRALDGLLEQTDKLRRDLKRAGMQLIPGFGEVAP